jgi:hypothetical protein
MTCSRPLALSLLLRLCLSYGTTLRLPPVGAQVRRCCELFLFLLTPVVFIREANVEAAKVRMQIAIKF